MDEAQIQAQAFLQALGLNSAHKPILLTMANGVPTDRVDGLIQLIGLDPITHKPTLVVLNDDGTLPVTGGGDTSDALNLKSAPFNAVGNGVADDTVAIKAWIAAGVAQGGGRLFAPRGNYKHTTSLPVQMLAATTGLEIYGEGRGVTVFTQATAATDSFVIGKNGAEVADNMYLHDFTITGTKYLLRLNNTLSGTFERLTLNGGTVGLYLEGQNESHTFEKIDIIGSSQNGILTGQLNGGTGLVVLDLPCMQKCLFEQIRLSTIGGIAVVITASNLMGQQTTNKTTFRHMLFELNDNNHQMTLDACDNITIDHMSVECATLNVASTYSGIRVAATLACGLIHIKDTDIPGIANDSTPFKYGIEAVGGNVGIDGYNGSGATTADIYLNGTGFVVNSTVAALNKLLITTPGNVMVIGLRNPSGVLL